MEKMSTNEMMTLAQQSNYEAQLDLAYCYARGDGVAQNYKEAIRWWKELANIVDPYNNDREYTDEEYDVFDKACEYIKCAQYELGYHYYNGIGVEQDFEEAAKWFDLGAGNNSILAMNDLAKCYYYGHGVKQDYKEAFKWFEEAAIQWHPESQYYLGWYYSEGMVVKADKRMAANWLLLSARGFYTTGAVNFKCQYMDKATEFFDCAINAWNRAAKMGYAEALYQLNHVCYYNVLTDCEINHIPFDLSKSAPWPQTPFSIADDLAGIKRKPLPKDVIVGDMIFHKSFGNGVVRMANDHHLEVDFETVGTKSFLNPEAFIDGYIYSIRD